VDLHVAHLKAKGAISQLFADYKVINPLTESFLPETIVWVRPSMEIRLCWIKLFPHIHSSV
jgi:hypothetical protein